MNLRFISAFTASFTNPKLILSVVLAISIPSREAFSAIASQDCKNQDAGGGDATHEKSPKTLVEAITGNPQNTGANGTGEPERLDPDRPHLPEASTAVGKGRILVEAGYTFNEPDLSSFTSTSHDFPEGLLRVGVLADWFELRVGQNFIKQRSTLSGATSRASGAADLYLGVKVALTEQKGLLPELALIPQMTVPTGNHLVTAGRTLPGLNVDGTWDIVKNRYSIEFVIGNNRVADDPQHRHLETATGFTHVFQVTRNLEAFGEWDVFYPSGNVESRGRARHYAVGGVVFFATKDFEIDFRAGAGLNEQANRFLIGTGLAFRH